jgi:hypothetical protein
MKNLLGIFKSRKVVYVVVGLAIAALESAFPSAPLPSVDLVTDLVLGLLATHTLTDVVALVTTVVGEGFRDGAKKPT